MRIETSDIHELPETNRIGHTCANLNGELFFIWGGSDDNNNNQNANDDSRQHISGDNNAAQLWIYETLTGYWRRRECSGECPPNLSGSTSCLIGRCMFVFGGHSLQLDNWLNNLYCLNLDTFNWTDLSSEAHAEPVPPIRCDKSCSWSYNSRFYAFGGYGWVQTEHLLQLLDIQKDLQLTPDMRWLKIGWNNQLVEYSTSDNTWRWPSYSGQCPSARAAHSGTLMGNKYYLFGGRNYQERLNDLYTLNMDTFEWTQIANFANSSLPAPSSSARLLQVSLPNMSEASTSGGGQLNHTSDSAASFSVGSDQFNTEDRQEQATFGLDVDSEMDYFSDSSDEDCEQEVCFKEERKKTTTTTITTTNDNNNDGPELARVGSQTFPSCSGNANDKLDTKQGCASFELDHHSNDADDDDNQDDAMSEDGMSMRVFIEQQGDRSAQDLHSHYNRHDSLASSTQHQNGQNQLISRSPSSNRNLNVNLDDNEHNDNNNDNLNNHENDNHNNNNNSQNNIISHVTAETAPLKPTGRSFASFTPISARDIILFGGISSQDEILDDCWLFNLDFNRWTKLDLQQAKPRLWHSGSRTRNNEVVIIGGSSSNKVDEFCSDVLTISLEPKLLKQLALDSVARSIRMKFINRQSSLPQTLIRLIKLRKQAIMLTMRSRQLKQHQQQQQQHQLQHEAS